MKHMNKHNNKLNKEEDKDRMFKEEDDNNKLKLI